MLRSLALLFVLPTALFGGAASAHAVTCLPTGMDAPRRALFASYRTPETSRKFAGRFELVRKLEDAGFRLTLVSDRFPERADAIAPTPEHLLAAFETLADDPSVRDLAIVLDLHGAPRKRGERTHSVLFGDAELSLDRFRPGLRRLRRRGVRVVLLDLSCYSGASLALARSGACVATSGSRKSENSLQVLDLFADALRPGMSFEDAFLAARRKHLMPRTPRISSDAGRSAMAGEEVLERVFAALDPAPVLGLEKRIERLPWSEDERRKVTSSFDLWRTQGPIFHGSFPPMLPDYAQAAIRFAPLVSAERSLYERNLRDYRDYRAEPSADEFETAASRACTEFAF